MMVPKVFDGILLIDSLHYATNCTRLDIAYAIVLSRLTTLPGNDHWHVKGWIMKYLSDTKNYGLPYKRYHTTPEGFNNADLNTL